MSDAFLPALVTFGPFFLWLIFSIGWPKSCPDCGETLFPIQSPFTKTKRQWIEGGYICTKCACEVDQTGSKVLPNTPLRFRTFVTAIVALILLTIVAGPLLFVLLQR